MASEQLSLELERKARDRGQSRVSIKNPDWTVAAVTQARWLRAVALGKGDLGDFLGEDLRLVIGAEIGQPTHPNAWGALIMRLAKEGLIEKTGAYRQMRSKGSHARATPAYRWRKP
jgi:hypothetical protein